MIYLFGNYLSVQRYVHLNGLRQSEYLWLLAVNFQRCDLTGSRLVLCGAYDRLNGAGRIQALADSFGVVPEIAPLHNSTVERRKRESTRREPADKIDSASNPIAEARERLGSVFTVSNFKGGE